MLDISAVLDLYILTMADKTGCNNILTFWTLSKTT